MFVADHIGSIEWMLGGTSRILHLRIEAWHRRGVDTDNVWTVQDHAGGDPTRELSRYWPANKHGIFRRCPLSWDLAPCHQTDHAL